MTIRTKRMCEIFNFGFEVLRMKQLITDKVIDVSSKDFEKGGNMYSFRNYTLERFENEFNTITWWG